MELPNELPLIRLFDERSSSFTYIVYDPSSREAAIIDPVLEQMERDIAALQAQGLVLRWSIETHAHADHVTGTGWLAKRLGAKSAAPSNCGITAAEQQVRHGDTLCFGAGQLLALHTPGHTPGSTCYLWAHAGRRCVFTGDTLLIDGCGRTDFQTGSAADLYDSITQTLFSLPDDTIVYPGHDYAGRVASTIGHERKNNRRMARRTRSDFILLMDALDLPAPRMIDEAVPANRLLGLQSQPPSTRCT